MSLTTAIIDAVKGNFVPKEIKDERKAVCDKCEHNFNGICSGCKCVISLKTAMPKERCPVNKWKEYVKP